MTNRASRAHRKSGSRRPQKGEAWFTAPFSVAGPNQELKSSHVDVTNPGVTSLALLSRRVRAVPGRVIAGALGIDALVVLERLLREGGFCSHAAALQLQLPVLR